MVKAREGWGRCVEEKIGAGAVGGGGGGRGGAEEREVGRELMSGRFVLSRFILSLS